MSFGQDIPNAVSVVVLIEDANGRQHGWKIHEPAVVKWALTGNLGGNVGAQATVTVSGTFQRMSKSPHSREIEERMIAAIDTLNPGGTNELPQ